MNWLWSAEHWAELTFWAVLAVALHFAIQAVFAFRVLMQRRPVGETMAWILIIFVVPVIGVVAYLIFGELRLGRRRERRSARFFPVIGAVLGELRARNREDRTPLTTDELAIARMSERTVGVPALAGNHLELIDQWQGVFQQFVADIDAAEQSIHMEFYIWNDGGEAELIVEALERARKRDVACRVLVDSLGSRPFLKGPSARRLRAAGVEVVGALPDSVWRLPFVRLDLRLHRKIVVVDGRIAYTGSLNLVDPRYFKQDAGVGQWVDAMVRIEGPAVEALDVIFLADWFIESNDDLDQLRAACTSTPQPPRGDGDVQVLPFGPGLAPRAVEQILITAVYSAREELVLTTPYFVPSDALSMALVAAARRGVRVVIVVPASVDSKLVRLASDAARLELLEAGVRIAAFTEGLLHTKSVTVDGEMSLFGSVNLDPRSFRLNFEILLAVFDRPFTGELRALQERYIAGSHWEQIGAYRSRPLPRRVAENLARLVAPLL